MQSRPYQTLHGDRGRILVSRDTTPLQRPQQVNLAFAIGRDMENESDIDQMIKTLSSRPLMYCSAIETGRDLIVFLLGACCGAIFPALGTSSENSRQDTIAFREYLYHRFNREPPRSGLWHEKEFLDLLLDQFGDKPVHEVCTEIGNLFRGIREDA